MDHRTPRKRSTGPLWTCFFARSALKFPTSHLKAHSAASSRLPPDRSQARRDRLRELSPGIVLMGGFCRMGGVCRDQPRRGIEGRSIRGGFWLRAKVDHGRLYARLWHGDEASEVPLIAMTVTRTRGRRCLRRARQVCTPPLWRPRWPWNWESWLHKLPGVGC